MNFLRNKTLKQKLVLIIMLTCGLTLLTASTGFIINDFILFPILFIALGFMFYALRYNKKKHLNTKPIIIGIIGTILILVGIWVSILLWLGVIGLFVSTIWDYMLMKNGKKRNNKQ